MYVPDEHVLSASYRFVEGAMKRITDRSQEFRYTMNSLMGLHRVRRNGVNVFLDIESEYHHLLALTDQLAGHAEDVAASIWTGRCIGAKIPAELTALFNHHFSNAQRLMNMTAQALAWAILACLGDSDENRDKALSLAKLASERYIHPVSGLVRHIPEGFRRNLASFAASCYMAYAFLRLARETGSDQARALGLRIARKLVKLQGPQGQWGWFYHVPRGKVLDYYPVYSVHQYSMAPFFLLEGIDQGYVEFREPLLRGFRWVLGQNEVGQNMVDATHRVIWRSVIRKDPFSKLTRFARAIRLSNKDSNSSIVTGKDLLVNSECRSYELGWALWAFGGREDFDEILNNACFV